MQIGINTWVWVSPLTDAELQRLVPHIKAIGFDSIELPIEAPNGFDYKLAAHLVRDTGLSISVAAAISPDRDLIDPNPAVRANGMAYVRHCIDAAHAMGSAILMGPMYSAVGRTWQMSAAEREHDIALLVSILQELVEYATSRDITLALEPLNRFETSLLNTAAQMVEVIDRVDHPNCQMMLDTFHMNIEEASLGDAIRLAGKRLKHFHACENDRGTPGSGHVPWDDVAMALHDIEYNGAIVIESFTDKVKSIARAAAIWRPLAPSQDHLAVEGLAFLRKLTR
jgi:D-psicose/D-tagatose/L-ribulose 3-epimerase